MHKIERLLQTLAPKGVEFRKLGDIGEFYSGLVGKSKKSFSQGNKFYVPYVNVFNNPQLDLNALESVQIGDKEKQNTIQLGDVLFTGSSENLEDCAMSCVVTQKIEKDIYLNSFCFGFRFFDENLFNPSFLKHLLRDYNFRKNISKVANGVTRFNVSKQLLSQITIPIPPLEIQQEIVKILDAFTELNTELKARKKQYQYYQNMLLDFNDANQNHKDAKMSAKTYPKNLKTLLQTLAPKGVEFRKLGEVCEIIRGKRVTKKEILDKGKYPVVSGGIGFMGYLNEYNREENTITIAQYGTAGFVNWQNQKFWANDVCFSVIPKETLINRYLYYVLTNMQNYLYSISNRSAIPYSISSNNIMQITIPIPPLEIQQEIVKILDQFSILTTDLLAGIPAEIEARKKQYEYYREKLLTFKPLNSHKEVKKC
ncbi:restriction endonuclease subunit S [Helicobacter pylori]|uniref:restriction endonuclease subunit S n=1 Tax=Helicobacter pylori TaxID=210 RepID=UPI001FD51225|nr:restriction endonuclease subunit S [Helicobacter pylori]UOS69413.1 restriction endonuclease subunit S [Helicobacter pylori]